MKSGSNIIKRYRIILAIISVLLVLSSSAVITGSWFTDSETIRVNFTRPNFDMTITTSGDQNNDHTSTIYLTYDGNQSSLAKTVGITVNQTTNVSNNVLRVLVAVEWGTMDNANFVSSYSGNNPLENILIPQYGNVWTGSYAAQNPSAYYMDSTSALMYYYNYYVNPQDNVQLFTGFELTSNEDTDTSLYVGKTAKITVISELAAASQEVFDDWTKASDANYEFDDYAPSSWTPTTRPNA